MKLSYEELKNVWNKKLENWQESDMLNVYIDNPFCIKRCKFCIYSPTKTVIGSELYNKYYNELLPNEIEKFSFILKKKIPDTIYFGGGTASLMTYDIMKKVFMNIPNFKKIKNKVFENHPSLLTKRKIDLFAKYNFSYISIGIQSFDKELLKEQDRIIYDFDKVAEMIEYAKSKNIKVNCDLLAFMKSGEVSDLEQFGKDLELMGKKLKPDIITIFPMYQRIHTEFTDENKLIYSDELQKEKNYKLISRLRRKMLKYNRKNNEGYKISNVDSLVLNKDEVLKHAKENYFFINMAPEEFHEIKQYSSSGFPHQPSNQNVLALGGYGPRKPYSYHGRKFVYENVNDGEEINYKEIYKK